MSTLIKIYAGIIIGTCLIGFVLSNSGTKTTKNKSYIITTRNEMFITDKYHIDANGCITFKGALGGNKTICGSYTIQ